MKRSFINILLTLAIAVPVTWKLAQSQPSMTQSGDTTRKVLYYQSAMHPWIKSDKPGRCTICGMELTPVYDGQQGFGVSEDVVALTDSMLQVLNVQTSAVKTRPLVKSLTFAGMIDDDATRHRLLSAYTRGRIDKLYVNYVGAEVEEGQPLAEFYSPALLQAEREYRALSGELREKTALRLRQMGLSSEQIKDLTNKDANILTTPILAPMTGTVVERHAYEGQYFDEGAELFEIADFSTMWFQFDLYENDLPWIKPGLPVEVTTPSHPGRVFQGSITFIDPNINPMTRSTKVRVELENPLIEGRRLLLHRLYADGEVKVDARETLTLPKAAIVQTGRDAVVYVEKERGQYERRVITTGVRGDEMVEVLGGVKEGQRVVTHGNLLLDGQAEMNRSFTQSDVSPEPASLAAKLTESQSQAFSRLIGVADAMAEALAADDLEAFKTASQPAMQTAGDFIEQMNADTSIDAAALKALDEARHVHGFGDIKQARVAFHHFTLALSPLAEILFGTEGAPEFQVWECGMVDQSIPGVPKQARWIQLDNRPGQNPFFGTEMLECAVRVKPAVSEGVTP